jgi:hypothetical protein
MKKLFLIFFLLLSMFEVLVAQSAKIKQSRLAVNSDSVWLLTYFRQRYPTRIEINAKGETVEVPLPNPMLVAQLHMALSTDGRHWTALNDNKPIWDCFMRDQFIHRGEDGLWRLIATGGSDGIDDRKSLGPAQPMQHQRI